MSHKDIITLPKFISKVPKLVLSMPSIIKGLKLAADTDKSKTVGVGYCVEKATESNPAGISIMQDNRTLSYYEFNAWANRIAHYLISIGIKKGDTIALLIENRAELLSCIVGCAKVGAISAMVNTTQRNRVLIHSINLVKPKLAFVGEELVEAYNEVADKLLIPDSSKYFIADCDTLKNTGVEPAGWLNLASVITNERNDNPITSRSIFYEDPCFYLYTSGTTGLPKAVVTNHGRFMKSYGAFGIATLRLKASDRIYVSLPFYHATALQVCWGSALAGGSGVILARKFSVSNFWDDIRRYEATAFGYVGELCRYLHNAPTKPNDKENKLRLMVGNGLRPNVWKPFKERFGIDRVMELYASSEGNIGFSNMMNFENTVGFCPYEYAIVHYDKDAGQASRNHKGYMNKVKKGSVGLLIGKITPKTPFYGYTDTDKTEACILGNVFEKGDTWFNTGDLMRDIGFKHAQFIDRTGDTFRWKGENVSTTEVELTIDQIDKISETVVYGVEIPDTNGRAGMAAICLDCKESEFSFEALLFDLKKEVPEYAIPIFLRINKNVETTGTFKHKKAPLKEAGFDLKKQDNPVYVRLPKAKSYIPLTEKIQMDIENNLYRF